MSSRRSSRTSSRRRRKRMSDDQARADESGADETRADENGAVQHGGLARGYRKVREGLVVSDKMDKTVVVVVEDRVKHPKYSKVIRRTKKYKAHDGANACGIGDRVLLMETKPRSPTKPCRVSETPE